MQHAGIAHRAKVQIKRIEAEKVEQEGAEKCLIGMDAVLVPGGFDRRGIAGKIEAIRFARLNHIPFFGICLGLQCAAIEFARNVLGLKEANSTEFNKLTPEPVVCLLDEQRKVTQIGGTMRLGTFDCVLLPETRARLAYGSEKVAERHRHRYEFNNDYRERFREKGWLISGTSPDGALVEVIELKDHPWFLAVQCHPEFKSKPTQAHSLFRAFVGAGISHRVEKKREGSRVRPVIAVAR